MVRENKYDVIIVGSGPSALSCAKILADNKVKVLLVQRSIHTVSPTFYSGLLFEDSLKGIFGKITDGKNSLSIERVISKQKSYVLDKDTFTVIDTEVNGENNFTVLRNSLISWMISQLDKAGVDILDETVVRDLILDNNTVIGIKTDSSDYFASTVVIAEGVKSILSKKAGLRKGEIRPEELYLFIEEVLELPAKTIEERFELGSGQGLSGTLAPKDFFSLNSIGYFHTNKKSITLGVGVYFPDLIKTGVNINFCMEGLKIHSLFRDLIRGAETIKYSSYILPKQVWTPLSNPTNLFGDGYLIIGGSAMMVDINANDISFLPLLSSKLAAEAILNKNLSSYQANLIKSLKEITGVAV